MSDDDKEKEYALLLLLLKNFIDSDDLDEWTLIESLAEQRAWSLVDHALKGYGISRQQAIDLINSNEDLNSQMQEVRQILRAAIDNMVEFGTAQEYQVVKKMGEALPYGIDEWEDLDEDEMEELLAVFDTYNKRYAQVEDLDVEYAMGVAASWVLINASSELMYMTQGDERVRPWHLQWEGYTAPKVMFPEWLIPPIEHQCRCYLVETGANAKVDILKDVEASIVKDPVIPEWFNPVFKESVCRGGRIFSDAHSYFQINKEDSGLLGDMVSRLKQKIYGGKVVVSSIRSSMEGSCNSDSVES